MYKDIDEAIVHAREVAEEQREIWEKYSDRYSRGGYAKCIKCAEEHEQIIELLEELKELRKLKDAYTKGMETSYSEFRYKQGRQDSIDECLQIVQKIKDDYNDSKFGEQIPINYGTICGIIIAMEHLKECKNG